MNTQTAVQLYSLGGQPAADPRGTVERIAELGYRGVEPVLSTGTSEAMRRWAESMGAPIGSSIDTAVLKMALDDHGLAVPSCHVALPEGAMAEAILDEQEQLGSSMIVVPALFDEEACTIEGFSDPDQIKRVAERFNLAAEAARARGIDIGYHNHFWELTTDIDGRTGLELFYELTEPHVFAEVDVYWAQLGGRDPVQLLRDLGSRVRLMHVKDGDGQLGTPSCALGAGVVDLPAVLAAAPTVEWHIVELEGLDDDEVWPLLQQANEHLAAAGKA